ncbi:hypothetical protein KIPB_001343 [Kipferlia bialata]|uniref:Uncharacterized protein n=1 Tax=Kipferlia bialata TaxID=797122 RepID=A0A9K3CQK3_9EUKA|nr:hypothetical protein KIPB_001343 [Kipferlia bialata]|eukprot:g1343.t1
MSSGSSDVGAWEREGEGEWERPLEATPYDVDLNVASPVGAGSFLTELSLGGVGDLGVSQPLGSVDVGEGLDSQYVRFSRDVGSPVSGKEAPVRSTGIPQMEVVTPTQQTGATVLYRAGLTPPPKHTAVPMPSPGMSLAQGGGGGRERVAQPMERLRPVSASPLRTVSSGVDSEREGERELVGPEETEVVATISPSISLLRPSSSVEAEREGERVSEADEKTLSGTVRRFEVKGDVEGVGADTREGVERERETVPPVAQSPAPYMASETVASDPTPPGFSLPIGGFPFSLDASQDIEAMIEAERERERLETLKGGEGRVEVKAETPEAPRSSSGDVALPTPAPTTNGYETKAQSSPGPLSPPIPSKSELLPYAAMEREREGERQGVDVSPQVAIEEESEMPMASPVTVTHAVREKKGERERKGERESAPTEPVLATDPIPVVPVDEREAERRGTGERKGKGHVAMRMVETRPSPVLTFTDDSLPREFTLSVEERLVREDMAKREAERVRLEEVMRRAQRERVVDPEQERLVRELEMEVLRMEGVIRDGKRVELPLPLPRSKPPTSSTSRTTASSRSRPRRLKEGERQRGSKPVREKPVSGRVAESGKRERVHKVETSPPVASPTPAPVTSTTSHRERERERAPTVASPTSAPAHPLPSGPAPTASPAAAPSASPISAVSVPHTQSVSPATAAKVDRGRKTGGERERERERERSVRHVTPTPTSSRPSNTTYPPTTSARGTSTSSASVRPTSSSSPSARYGTSRPPFHSVRRSLHGSPPPIAAPLIQETPATDQPCAVVSLPARGLVPLPDPSAAAARHTGPKSKVGALQPDGEKERERLREREAQKADEEREALLASARSEMQRLQERERERERKRQRDGDYNVIYVRPVREEGAAKRPTKTASPSATSVPPASASGAPAPVLPAVPMYVPTIPIAVQGVQGGQGVVMGTQPLTAQMVYPQTQARADHDVQRPVDSGDYTALLDAFEERFDTDRGREREIHSRERETEISERDTLLPERKQVKRPKARETPMERRERERRERKRSTTRPSPSKAASTSIRGQHSRSRIGSPFPSPTPSLHPSLKGSPGEADVQPRHYTPMTLYTGAEHAERERERESLQRDRLERERDSLLAASDVPLSSLNAASVGGGARFPQLEVAELSDRVYYDDDPTAPSGKKGGRVGARRGTARGRGAKVSDEAETPGDDKGIPMSEDAEIAGLWAQLASLNTNIKALSVTETERRAQEEVLKTKSASKSKPASRPTTAKATKPTPKGSRRVAPGTRRQREREGEREEDRPEKALPSLPTYTPSPLPPSALICSILGMSSEPAVDSLPGYAEMGKELDSQRIAQRTERDKAREAHRVERQKEREAMVERERLAREQLAIRNQAAKSASLPRASSPVLTGAQGSALMGALTRDTSTPHTVHSTHSTHSVHSARSTHSPGIAAGSSSHTPGVSPAAKPGSAHSAHSTRSTHSTRSSAHTRTPTSASRVPSNSVSSRVSSTRSTMSRRTPSTLQVTPPAKTPLESTATPTSTFTPVQVPSGGVSAGSRSRSMREGDRSGSSRSTVPLGSVPAGSSGSPTVRTGVTEGSPMLSALSSISLSHSPSAPKAEAEGEREGERGREAPDVGALTDLVLLKMQSTRE